MRQILIIVTIILAAGMALAQRTVTEGFERGTAADYLPRGGAAKGVVLAPANGANGNCLQLSRGIQGTFSLHPVPVEAEKKYLFSFRGRVDGDDVIEKNARIDVLQVAAYNLLPQWKMEFFAADGKSVAQRSFRQMTLVSEEWRTYTDVFYVPTGAVTMQASFVLPNAENGVLLDDLTLGPAPDEGAINCNPDFRYGPCNYAGWASLNTGALLVAIGNGKYGLDTAYGSSTENFPLREPGTYRLYAKGTTRGGFRTVDLRLYDEKGGLIKTRNIVALPNGNSVDFLLPEGTVRANLLVYNHILEEVRLIRMGDASKLAELDAARAAGKK